MKNIIAIIILLTAAINTNAQVIGTFSSTVEGSIRGEVSSLNPILAFHGNESNTTIFDKMTVTEEATTFSINNNTEDENFSAFVQNLVSMDDSDLIKVGHNINGIKTFLSSDVNGWFGTKIDFSEYNVTKVTISYEKINFKKVEKNSLENKSWSDFSYKVTVSIYGQPNTISAY